MKHCERITNGDASFLCARAFIPSGVWLKSPSAPSSKHYYMALCLGFSSQMSIWGPTWRQIGYQSQGWYKDCLWKSISRQSYIGLAYLFLHHSVWGPSLVQASAQSLTYKTRSGPSEPDRNRMGYATSHFLAPCSQHMKLWSPHKDMHIKNPVPIFIYQCEFSCRDHVRGHIFMISVCKKKKDLHWILHFASIWMVEPDMKCKENDVFVFHCSYWATEHSSLIQGLAVQGSVSVHQWPGVTT